METDAALRNVADATRLSNDLTRYEQQRVFADPGPFNRAPLRTAPYSEPVNLLNHKKSLLLRVPVAVLLALPGTCLVRSLKMELRTRVSAISHARLVKASKMNLR